MRTKNVVVGLLGLTIALSGAGDSAGATGEKRLVSSTAQTGDDFGTAVAISGDTVVALEPINDYGSGIAHVFAKDGSDWSEQQTIVPSGNIFVYDAPVGIGGDTIALGSISNSTALGMVQVYVRSGTTWTEQQTLTPDAGSSFAFGSAVAVGGDTIVVSGSGSEAAWVFVRSGTTWTEQQKLTPSDGGSSVSYGFGASVAISGDVVVIGARYRGNDGAVYVYERSGATWTEQAILPEAGWSVAVSGDTFVAGSPYAGDGVTTETGTARVFVRSGATWSEQAELAAVEPAGGDRFGAAVAIDGDAIVVGAPQDGYRGLPGACHSFTRTGGTWSAATRFTTSVTPLRREFGASVALDGGKVVVGATGGEGSATPGGTFVFDVEGGAEADLPAIPPPAPTRSFFLPKVVKRIVNAKKPEKGGVFSVGIFDTGPQTTDLSGPATLTIGDVVVGPLSPTYDAKLKRYTVTSGNVTMQIIPHKSGSSKAKFAVKIAGDPTGVVAADADLTFRFQNAQIDAWGTVRLELGKYKLKRKKGLLSGPTLFPYRVKARIAGGGKDAFVVRAGFASDGVPPAQAPDVSFWIGDHAVLISGAKFVRHGDVFICTKPVRGVTKVVLDYRTENLSFFGRNVDLGPYAPGGTPLYFGVALGDDARGVSVRGSLKKKTLQY
jgi:hypothetical protein